MKFSEKYPDMIPLHEELYCIIRGREPGPCHKCGEPTEYVDVNFEANFCSDECLSKFKSELTREQRLEVMERTNIVIAEINDNSEMLKRIKEQKCNQSISTLKR